MASFSGALKLVDLDDFITPSQVSYNTARVLHVLTDTDSENLETDSCTESLDIDYYFMIHVIRLILYFILQECIKPVKIEKTSDKVSTYCHLLHGTGVLKRF